MSLSLSLCLSVCLSLSLSRSLSVSQARPSRRCTDDAGRIYYTFDPALPPAERQRADMAVLLRWGADGTGEPEVLGPTAAARQSLAQV